MKRIATVPVSLLILLHLLPSHFAPAQQPITLDPMAGQMNCVARVPALGRASFILGLPETIASSEGMILNFPEVTIQWEGPNRDGVVQHTWRTEGKIEYTVRVIPHVDYVDAEMRISNLTAAKWTKVFSFNCLNPGSADQFKDWDLKRTYMSKNGRPFRMDSTVRVNNGSMKTVQWYLHRDYANPSPFVTGFQATSPDRTDDSYIVTLADDGSSYMAATSPSSNVLFDNLDRCCLHSTTNFGDIPAGGERTVTSRFYMAKGTLNDFLARFNAEIKKPPQPDTRVLLCYGNPWELADTAKWSGVYGQLDLFKFYIDGIDPARIGTQKVKDFLAVLLKKNIRIAVEMGGLVDWRADKKDQSAEFSFLDEFAKLKPFIAAIKEIDPSRNIDMLDFDGPIRRMLYPNNAKADHHTLSTAVAELFEVLQMYRDSIPGVEVNLLTNFPNWAWGTTPSYFAIDGNRDGYGRYEDVLDSVQARSLATGRHFDGLTVDNPYDYATGVAQTNQPAAIAGVDWMQRLEELDAKARGMGLKVNMIFNSNGGRTAKGYSDQTLAFIDLYHSRVAKPDGYWIQSWYQLPGAWLPEGTPYTMTNITLEAMKKLAPPVKTAALMEPPDGRVYHGACMMTYETTSDPLAGYLGMLPDSTQPAARGLFFSIPGTRGPANSLRELANYYKRADSVGFIPELSLFLVSDVATDSAIAMTTQYDWVIDSIAAMSKTYGKRMFLRIGGEFNGAGPGWNGGGYHPYIFVTMFQKIVDRFAAKGMRDSIATIWCYEPDAPNDFDSTDGRGARWYPGDSYVDWFGIDVFNVEHFDQALPDYVRGAITRKGKSERFLAMARAKGKPVYMSETSAHGVNISADPADGIADWDNWFAKFFAFIAAHTEIKGFSYIDANWPVGAYPGWGDARIRNSAYVMQKYLEEMRNPKYIHLPVKRTTGVETDLPYSVASGITLFQNYPNPASGTSTFTFELPADDHVLLGLYDTFGRRVSTVHQGAVSAGRHSFDADLSRLVPGVYSCTLSARGTTVTRMFVVAR
ncbi:MAG: T9SS type A sorting domain-containing protein [Ignavibacteria bacterium]|nr:T9SS type A sorting domain-containing protein [Ignavibacteria bacterium]